MEKTSRCVGSPAALPPALVSAPPAAPPSSPLSLHDALPIRSTARGATAGRATGSAAPGSPSTRAATSGSSDPVTTVLGISAYYHDSAARSEEHTSELQSLTTLVCRLLLEKKNENHGKDIALRRLAGRTSARSCFRAAGRPPELPSFPTRRSSDPLDRSWRDGRTSNWIRRPREPVDPGRYERQF